MEIPTGFEKFFVESWEDFDFMKGTFFIFYNAKIRDIFGIPVDFYDVYIDLDSLTIQVIDEDDEVYTGSIVIGLGSKVDSV